MAEDTPVFPNDEEPARTPPANLDYEALRQIGRGGYGEVWLVRDKAGRYLACKVIYRVSFENDRPYEREYEGIKRFEPVSRASESQVNILHVGRRDEAGYFYYIMELADDVATGQQFRPEEYVPRTLRSELKRRGRLPIGECVRLGLSLSGALENLHEHGLIHRDIKPANIIFVNGIPKLADIGLVTDRDVTVSYVGTEGYIPPEGPGSAQADVYGLGKVLYEMSTGKDRLDFPELPTNLGSESEQTSLLELNAVAVKACEPNARKRYPTAGELHSDLTLLSSGKSLRQRRRNAQRVRTLKLAAIATVIILVVSALAVIGFQKLRSRPGAHPDALTGGTDLMRTPATSAALANVCIRTGFEAYAENDYARAAELVTTARKAAEVTHDGHLMTEANFLSAEIMRCEPEYKAVASQIGLLDANPDDPKSNLAAGKFLCLVKNDWEDGLRLLARGDNEALSAAAGNEMMHTDPVTMGDGWWHAADVSSGNEKIALQQRARVWYLRAISRAKPQAKAAIKQRVADRIQPITSPYGELHIVSRVGNVQNIDIYADSIHWKSEGLSLDDRVNHVLLGDLRDKSSSVIHNNGATRLYPEAIDFSTARLKIDRKGKKRGDARLEISEDHVRVVLTDKPAGTSELAVTVTFGTPP